MQPRGSGAYRPRGTRSTLAAERRRHRALERNFLLPSRTGYTYMEVPLAIKPELKHLALSTDATRALEIKTGIHRRNGAQLRDAALASGHIDRAEANAFKHTY